MNALHLIQILPAVLTLLASGLVLYRQRSHWTTPTRKLTHLLTEVRAGRVPIEEVRAAATGGLAPLAPLLVGILHDLRQQQHDRACLSAEMDQRIANRTEALERNLSSLKNQSQRDSLTGLYNRRAFDQAFPRIIDQCRSSHADLYVFMIDLDRFKNVNDTLGHLAGDALISDVGQLIRSHLRSNDFAFRYGGDEFVLLLPGVDFEVARQLAERLTQLGAQLGQTLKIRPAPGLSVGMASLNHNPTASPAELVEFADQALYANKTARRSA
ncbi:MAG TPA: GGDEF domain-containing protein [Tepidisphaeraceae bacterium]|jgi:diguanylate cyclase|nr:GGDEF domain-containing protein [Tepidisphaeraceae bacterium]